MFNLSLRYDLNMLSLVKCFHTLKVQFYLTKHTGNFKACNYNKNVLQKQAIQDIFL